MKDYSSGGQSAEVPPWGHVTLNFQVKSKTTLNHLAFGLRSEALDSHSSAAVTDIVHTNVKRKIPNCL